MSTNILQYESTVWATADLLIGAGIKQSDFPKFMMPFFALIMVESRLLRLADEKREEFDKGELEEMLEEIKDDNKGYNDVLLRQGKTLADICKNDKAFDIDYQSYLRAFDPETQLLLGVDRGNTEEKFMDISGISGQLKKKRILFATVKAWSEIDLRPFSNSEITTLEEHIKRRWADISAETAGEQYTPDDVIKLIAELICSKLTDGHDFLTIYDATCGGGNMLFGVEDVITENFPHRPTKTFGQDWNDALYALAKIESRFRQDSQIEYGNTLTDIKFIDKQFSISVANPPYGVDWKGYRKDIENDKTGRFVALPAVSDGQLLFTQHIVSHMAEDGLAVVVHNGSTLFSGDAGSGESTIRKYFFEQDIVEAIIQLPTDEFFNTNIYTYLWVFNKNKPHTDRAGKVMLLNASQKFKPLKKNKGKKRKEMDEDSRAAIVQALVDFEDNDFARVFDAEYFFFNKQAIMLTNVDEKGRSYEEQLKKVDKKTGAVTIGKSKKLRPITVSQIDPEQEENNITIQEFVIEKVPEGEPYKSLKDYYDNHLKELIKKLDYKEQDLEVVAKSGTYRYDPEKETLLREHQGKTEELGCGKIVVKASYKKASKSRGAQIDISVELTPDYQKDYEIIPYSKDPEQNRRNIEAFMAQYITKPFRYLDNVVGVEINFNKVFYEPEKLRPIGEIMAELAELDKELVKLEKELEL
ncbi:MAG: N-6 DNA methylase [Lewinellaceae bacterium]|nr:N-6 DNA methylase [Phaeodactylibacter sp.]MCB9041679.1 N-6 DNA methylase [Lewinellaceae bacterium]